MAQGQCPTESVSSFSGNRCRHVRSLYWIYIIINQNFLFNYQVLVTGSLHLIGDVLKIVKKWGGVTPSQKSMFINGKFLFRSSWCNSCQQHGANDKHIRWSRKRIQLILTRRQHTISPKDLQLCTACTSLEDDKIFTDTWKLFTWEKKIL